MLKKGNGQLEMRLFLMGDAAACAKAGQIGVGGTCMNARGIDANDLIEGVHRCTLDELTEWRLWSDKELVF